MPRVVWAEESKTGLGFEIGPSHGDVPTTSQCVAAWQSSCIWPHHRRHGGCHPRQVTVTAKKAVNSKAIMVVRWATEIWHWLRGPKTSIRALIFWYCLCGVDKFSSFIFYAWYGILWKGMGESFLLSKEEPLTPNIDGVMTLWIFRRRAQNTQNLQTWKRVDRREA